MFAFAKLVRNSWVVEKIGALAWYYRRRIGLPTDLEHWFTVRPHHTERRARVVPWRLQEDAFLTVNLFSDRNPWERYDLPFDPAVVVDLGANRGQSLLYWAQRFPNARIVGVEMDKQNADQCQSLVAKNGLRVEVVNCAIAREDGKAFYRRFGASTGHRIADLCDEKYQYDKELVPIDSFHFDSFLKAKGLDRVDLLKVDIEGAEQFLLETLESWLPRVGTIVLELHHNIDFAWARGAIRAAGRRIVDEDDEARTELVIAEA